MTRCLRISFVRLEKNTDTFYNLLLAFAQTSRIALSTRTCSIDHQADPMQTLRPLSLGYDCKEDSIPVRL